MKNFYPKQYSSDKSFKINHNYLGSQFNDYEIIFEKMKEVVVNNDFTLGVCVDEVEEIIAKEANTKYAVSVGSGTDALFLSLKALGVKEGDEVITTTYTFYATIGAIVTAGAKPVFCDCREDFNLDPNQIESKITSKTKAIMPVHWSGRPCDMESILSISKKHSIPVVEDACHALQAELNGQRAGSFGETGCFSFHPLKNLNVWGDGGIVTTNNNSIAKKLKLIRNHGLINRDTCIEFGYNSRLDTIQAVIAKHVLENKLDNITSRRIENAQMFDKHLKELALVNLPPRYNNIKEVFHLYSFSCANRSELVEFLRSKNIDAKIHYPIPMHLQPAAKKFNYKKGEFPIAEKLANSSISLPVHEYISAEDISFTCGLIKEFFSK
tara:strand:- start:3559 stop:4704 length:1146 start_codon:yes stop_codon:yes gene_type:complete